MDREQVHYEVLVRKKSNSGWSLEFATENRTRALEEAELALSEKRAVSVRVTKETLDAETSRRSAPTSNPSASRPRTSTPAMRATASADCWKLG